LAGIDKIGKAASMQQEAQRLIKNIDDHDGIIASRYMPGAVVDPPRPWIKKWGVRLAFNPLVRFSLGIHYYDTQCGAKLFKRNAMETIVDHLTMQKWALDIEMLYLCELFGYTVREFPTVWHDQEGSKLDTFSSGMRMLGSVRQIRKTHHQLKKDLSRSS